MTNEIHKNRQQLVVDKVTEILSDDQRVLGVLIAGSHSSGDNDAFSDIDMACYLRDEDLAGRKELYDQIAEIHPLLCRLWIYDRNSLYLFDNGVRLDLDFLKPSDLLRPAHLYSGAMVVHDPDGTLSKHISKVKLQEVAEHPRWFEPGSTEMLDWFFWMFRQIVCWSTRAAQGGMRSFDKLSDAVDSLAEVRTRIKEMRLWTIGKQDYLENIDPVCAANLSVTFPHLAYQEVIDCSKMLLAEFERIGPDYCRKAGVGFPSEKAHRMGLLIEEFESIARSSISPSGV